MITPFPPPPGPRVELLRVRRVDPTMPAERSGPSPLRDPGELPPPAPQTVDRIDLSEDALHLLPHDPQRQSGETP